MNIFGRYLKTGGPVVAAVFRFSKAAGPFCQRGVPKTYGPFSESCRAILPEALGRFSQSCGAVLPKLPKVFFFSVFFFFFFFLHAARP